MASRRIAFFGLGNMGMPMASNLVRAGHRVVAFDPKVDANAGPHVPRANDPGAAVDGADVVLSLIHI